MILLHVYGFVIFLYVLFRLVAELPYGQSAKLFFVVWAFFGSQYHFFVRYYFGTLASPEMPYPALVLWGFSYVTLALLFALLFLRDLFRLAAFGVRKARGAVRVPFSPGRRAMGMAGLGFALGAYGFSEAVRVPDVRSSEVILDRLLPALDGLVIVQITDLHATALLREPRVAAVVEAVNALQPDFIFCTGDMVDGTTEARAQTVAPLKGLRARYGVFGCEGNHEYYSGYGPWMRTFANLGVNILHNRHLVVPVKGGRLVIAALNDPAGPGFGQRGPDIAKALENAPVDAPVILLAHRPEFARTNAAYPVDLQLSGHTHGGQIIGFDRIVASRNAGFLRGWYQVGSMKLHVSPGAGLWTGFPVRVGVPAEISRIVLRAPAR